jgi:hypothetical protein
MRHNANGVQDVQITAPSSSSIANSKIQTSTGFEAFPMRWKHFLRQLDEQSPKGWNFVPSATSDAKKALVYVNKDPVKFMFKRGLLPLRIHPDDVRYGYRVHGVVLEPVDGRLTMRNFEREFRKLKIDPDGYVRITFNITNLAGEELPVTVALEVTPDAVRRGTNIDYYIQREFCGACGNDTWVEDAKRFYATGQIEPLDQLVGACRLTDSRIELKKPYVQEVGLAHRAALPELAGSADSTEAARRSSFLLCEGENVLPEPHSPLDNIRRYGRGRYSHWGEYLYFSSSDGSDPNKNGREYALVRKPGH